MTLRGLLLLLTTLTLMGCGKGLDRSPDFTSHATYKATVDAAFTELSNSDQGEAFNWAVSDQTIDSLAQKYKGKSFRQIGLMETEGAIKTYQNELARLDKEKLTFDPIMNELAKVTAKVTGNGLETDAFGRPKFWFSMDVSNGSNLELSTITWVARLYLNEDKDPAAQATAVDSYESLGGLKPTNSKTRKFTPDTFFSKDWVTLSVQSAKTRRIEVSLQGADDFSNKPLLANSPYARIEKTKKDLALAEKYLASLNTK